MRGRSYIDNIIVKYLDWRQKDGYAYCKVCGKEIKKSYVNSNIKYCGKCAKEIKLKNDAERIREKRKK